MLSNLSEVLQVCLAAHQHSLWVDVILFAPLAILKLLPPLLHTIESFPVCNIVGQHHCIRPPVVEGANWGELFLSSRVPQISAVSRAQSETGSELDKKQLLLPDLKFDDFVLHRESFNIEIHPNGGHRVTVEIVVHIPLHQGRLTASLETQFSLSYSWDVGFPSPHLR